MINPLKVITKIKLGDVRSSCCVNIPEEEESEEHTQKKEEKKNSKNKKNVNGK